jgi:hypothetical protein
MVRSALNQRIAREADIGIDDADRAIRATMEGLHWVLQPFEDLSLGDPPQGRELQQAATRNPKPRDVEGGGPPPGPHDVEGGGPPPGPHDVEGGGPPPGPHDVEGGGPPPGPHDVEGGGPPPGPNDVEGGGPPPGPNDVEGGGPPPSPQDIGKGHHRPAPKSALEGHAPRIQLGPVYADIRPRHQPCRPRDRSQLIGEIGRRAGIGSRASHIAVSMVLRELQTIGRDTGVG